ncbi:arsenite oxidase small subunit [Sulfolobus sp. A20]|uniref:arsenate reductase (azurin) small subunit n=1 Tax=Saccharolobus sp. A20 TaxID=1891280 RepID=UPI000845C853|nr:arsenate reductase (azurin) small subunit [Sulfolobus sp. A20]TRM75134.1 arsenate reductase (azurin) small subunit [Sulfolobus sp. E5]TRM76691.1 arsenate reductase (azurin) small subunit [Sulfolobus sp. B5]TRM81734.1 arsenate reductase (azurin) small subunit [Sulfolobus sp. A20-N-F6]TRM86925.1 arsenate reductase (azurin) small subunit [Sulfolobus sp. E3]TRM87522.1 arsenate reductase (azurin) small subunit [Sulfolobus sp. C3]TRN04638.1 arsenate reductase (azurin) small subunit [Sulfolobus s
MSSKEEKKGSNGKDPDPNRRAIIIGGAAAVAGIAAGIVIGGEAFPRVYRVQEVVPQVQTTTVTSTVTQQVVAQYQKQLIANYSELSVGVPKLTTYMGYPIVVVRTGTPSIGGVGPNGDVVAFSAVCVHMGGPVQYDPNTNCGVCPYHYSQYDFTRGGMQVVGHPNQYLPQVILEYDSSTGNIYALGFNRLLYGVYDNVLQASTSSSTS